MAHGLHIKGHLVISTEHGVQGRGAGVVLDSGKGFACRGQGVVTQAGELLRRHVEIPAVSGGGYLFIGNGGGACEGQCASHGVSKKWHAQVFVLVAALTGQRGVTAGVTQALYVDLRIQFAGWRLSL